MKMKHLMARKVVVTIAKAARATGAGATRMAATAATAATMTMTPNGDEDNEDGNSKINDKATTIPTSTTEGGERCQSHRNNRGGGHPRPPGRRH